MNLGTVKINDEELELKKKQKKMSFFDVRNSYHVLPVFAAGRAFVPSTFDTLICQSFFNPLTPLLVETFATGQENQTMYQVDIPRTFIGREFLDLFRACNARNVLIIGLYRGACKSDKSLLPFVFACPKKDLLLRKDDRMFVFANPSVVDKCLSVLERPLSQCLVLEKRGPLFVQGEHENNE